MPQAMPLTVIEPNHGDILTHHDGTETDEGLRISVYGTAPDGHEVTVNGQPAEVEQGYFSCEITLNRCHNIIVAKAGRSECRTEVWWNPATTRRYRISVDDSIFFLKDLAAQPNRYASLFDHWYLKFWRELHEEFGTKAHFNLFYQTDGFDVTEMPDRWRDEWAENADWLNMTFHGLQDKPDRPYRNARYMQIAHDFDLVTAEIRRFAGNTVVSKTTTLHWAECPEAAITALRDRGVEQLVALFDSAGGPCRTGYYLSADRCTACDNRGAWYDADTRLTFIRCAAVLDQLEPEEVPLYLEARTNTPHTSEMLEVIIHEPYFRQEHDLYQPNAMDKVRAAVNWATLNEYSPVFWSDGLLGMPIQP